MTKQISPIGAFLWTLVIVGTANASMCFYLSTAQHSNRFLGEKGDRLPGDAIREFTEGALISLNFIPMFAFPREAEGEIRPYMREVVMIEIVGSLFWACIVAAAALLTD